MKYKYISALPYTEIIKLIVNEKAKEFWIVFAYFSKNKIIEVLEKLKSRENPAIVHLVLSASSVNPLQDIVQDVLNLSTEEWFDFHLVEEPLMHTKLFAVKFDENIKIYIGSANFTNKAQISNIESGIFFDCCNMSNTVAYLDKLTKTCSRDDSVALLLSKAILSHFRSELLFLAIEESKTKQAISIKPEKIKNILSSYSSNDGEEGTVTVKTKNMINIFVLDDNERIKLLEAESALKNSIKETCAIKIEGYGYISSLWSL